MNLSVFLDQNLFDAGTDLFKQLSINLNSNTTISLDLKDVLKEYFKAKDIFSDVTETYFLGLIDDDMLRTPLSLEQAENKINNDYNGLMVFAVRLSDNKTPTRSNIADLTRAFNRASRHMPVVLLVQYGNLLAFSTSERMKYQQIWHPGEKIGKVSMLKDIDLQKTHAGHSRILEDLIKKSEVKNFNDLYEQWKQVFNIQILNRRFYQELSNWYFWASAHVSFPDDIEKDKNIRNATGLIRLITRIIFIWFVKEKQLVPEKLFDPGQLGRILKEFAENKESHSFYQAVLQNLFFGTLNQKMNERRFAEDTEKYVKRDQGVKSLFRYKELFSISEHEVLDLFASIPFLNGGLFDCLDKDNPDTEKHQFVDGFSLNPNKQAIVPDFLFFHAEEECDLNAIYGTKNKKYKVKGLFDILSAYKFTIAENTPVEEEIALDPELLGKVFENLLASYNPETQTTARKQTGSFYTPREIVNYMVDESLLAYFAQNLTPRPPLQRRGGELPGYVTTDAETYKVLKPFALENRKNATEAEAALWEELRNKKTGYKFRRQHPIDKFIVDFVCLPEKLVIEVDGGIHDNPEQREYDAKRTARLNELGYWELRFKNEQILDNIKTVISDIRSDLSSHHPTHPTPGPSPEGRGAEISPSPLERGPGGEVFLRDLISYSENPNPFDPEQTKILIKAIDNCKILDPACGSGAFPMGILHKLVHCLHKLDPNNENWREIQRQKAIKDTEEAFRIGNKQEREERLIEISDIFENNSDDYGRKLYLIENCIYGVDIQPIAVQISKLRFFISLIVDQKVNHQKDNLGIRALPNLETKFVAANTLIGLDKPEQRGFKNPKIQKLEEDLRQLRHHYFNAKTRKEKLDYQKKDKALRQEIAQLLIKDKWGSKEAEQMAEFDPYDQNAKSPFFDMEWMFGIKDGFDIVIGNPPYIQIQKFDHIQKIQWEEQQYQTFDRMGDIYCLFYEKGYQLLAASGLLCFISSNKWMRAEYGLRLRKFFTEQTNPLLLIDFGNVQVFDATVNANILLLQKAADKKQIHRKSMHVCRIDNDFNLTESLDEYVSMHGYHITQFTKATWIVGAKDTFDIKTRIEKQGIPLTDWNIKIYRGILTGCNDAFIIDRETKDKLALEPENAELLKPVLTGKDIQKWKAEFKDSWLINTHNGLKEKNIPPIDVKKDYPVIWKWLEQFREKLETRQDKGKDWTNLRNCSYLEEFEKPKIIWGNLTLNAKFALDTENLYLTAPSNLLTMTNPENPQEIKYLLAVLNSKISSYYMQQIGISREGGYLEYKKIFVEKIPIKRIPPSEQEPFIRLVDYILFLKQQALTTVTEKLMPVFFEHIINGLSYELYLPESVGKSGRAFAKHLQNLPDISDLSDKMRCVSEIFTELYKQDHPIRNAVFFIDSVPEIAMIERAVKF